MTLDLINKIIFNLNIIEKKIINCDFNKKNFNFDNFTLLNKINKLEIKGIPYLCKSKGIPFIIKIFPHISKKTNTLLNIEIIYSLLFNKDLLNKQISPNFVTIYDHFYYIKNTKKCLVDIPFNTLNKISKLDGYSDILIYEYASEKDIDSLYFSDKKLGVIEWKSILFQVIYTLCILQDKYHFMHNDLHPANVLIDKIKPIGNINYIFNDTSFNIPNSGYIVKIWDFEFSNMFKDKYINIQNECIFEMGYCKFFDLHAFLKGLLDLPDLPNEIITFIRSLYPKYLLYSYNTEYIENGFLTLKACKSLDLIIPEKLIYHDFFKEYINESNTRPIYTFKYN